MQEPRWLKLCFRVDSQYYDQLSDVLEACLALSVSIENAGEDEFFEIAFPGKPTWQLITVTALFYDGVDTDAIIDFVNKSLEVSQPFPVVVEKMQDQDWERVWLDQYQALQISSDFWIVPSWQEDPNPNAINLKMDPGLAFGTGTHATTFLCIDWIVNNARNVNSVLDYGAGSGILAIAALLVGASSADLVDIDPMAVQAAKDNLLLNGVSENATSLVNSDFVLEGQYELVIANILAEVLVEKASYLISALSDKGTLLLSGILSSQEDLIRQAFLKHADLNFEKHQKDDWLLLVLTKNPS